VDEVAVEQRIDPVDQTMRSTPFEPDVPSEMTLARSDSYEPATRLKDDPCLLGIYVDRPDRAHSEHQRIKDFADLRALAFEVFLDCVISTGV